MPGSGRHAREFGLADHLNVVASAATLRETVDKTAANDPSIAAVDMALQEESTITNAVWAGSNAKEAGSPEEPQLASPE
ncbi:MAG: hypothetical protein ACR2QK_02440 [Acidimicrobiales bacterium]